MQLNDIQERFKDLMLDQPDALQAPREDFAALFEGDVLSERLKVYRNNIVGSLTDIIITNFPLLEKLVGKDFLKLMARSFVLQNPPMQGCLNHYGEGFDIFIENFAAAKTMAYLPDVARLELAIHESYYARDEEFLTAQDMAAVPADELENIILPLCDHVRLINPPYPLLAIREFCNVQGEAPDMSKGGGAVMVARPVFEVQLMPLDQDAFLMLTLLQKRMKLEEAVTAVLAQYPDFNFQAFLQKHLALGSFGKAGLRG